MTPEQIEFGKLLSRWRKKNSVGKCLYVDATGARCKNDAVASHTIQRSTAIAEIADGGHVYRMEIDPFGHHDTNGRQFKPIGKSNASTFPGFCGRHDRELFLDIEGGIEIIERRSLFLLAYRQLNMELFKTELSIRTFKSMLAIERLPNHHKQSISEHLTQTAQDLMSLRTVKAHYDNALHSGDFSQYIGAYFKFNETLPLALATSLFTPFDFTGQPAVCAAPFIDQVAIYAGRLSKDTILSASAFIAPNSRYAQQMIDSFQRIPPAYVGEVALNISTAYGENSYFRPTWVESLTREGKLWMLERSGGPSYNPSYTPDRLIGLPGILGMAAANLVVL